MTHKLTDAEGLALSSLALALRPDWSKNNPGKIIHDHQQENGGIVQASDFPHAVKAMLSYATAGGAERKRTPNLFVEDGRHWESTRPAASAWGYNPPSCAEHPEFEAHNCRCCWSEVKAGEREPEMVGKSAVPDYPPMEIPDGMTRYQYLMRRAADNPPPGVADEFPDEAE